MEEESSKGPSHNNPKEAANYLKAVNLLLEHFVSSIHGFNRDKHLDAWRLFCTLYPNFSPNWKAHISTRWTQQSYLIQYQTKPVMLSLHTLKRQRTEYSNMFPVTRYQTVLKFYPECAYKKIYHV